MRIPMKLARGILASAESDMPLDHDSIEELRACIRVGEAERNRVMQTRAARARSRKAERLAAKITEV